MIHAGGAGIGKNNKDGVLKHQKHAIFAAYHQSEEIPISNLNYIKSLVNCGFTTIYIHNGPLSNHAISMLDPYCSQIISRVNIGQDFGAWKDGIKYCEKHNILDNTEWLLLCNDSNFFLGGANGKFFENTLNKSLRLNKFDLIAANKNLDTWHHYQSFFLCIHKRLFTKRSFVAFWDNYVPLSHRYHAINNGEIKLSKDILNSAEALILYDVPKLGNEIQHSGMSIDDLNFLPLIALLNLGLDNARCNSKVSKISQLNILSRLERHNPSHFIALLSNKYLRSPFLKKDLYRGGTYSLMQIVNLLELEELQVDANLIQSIIGYYLATGANFSYINLPRQAFQRGVPISWDQFAAVPRQIDLFFTET
jgi:hypothetical protein